MYNLSFCINLLPSIPSLKYYKGLDVRFFDFVSFNLFIVILPFVFLWYYVHNAQFSRIGWNFFGDYVLEQLWFDFMPSTTKVMYDGEAKWKLKQVTH